MEDILRRIRSARFLTTDEVFEKRKQIRREVQKFDVDTLEVYKWYFFFQLCLLKNPLKEKLWNYLVKDVVSIYEETDLVNEYRHYKEKCQKILQYQRKSDEETGYQEEELEIKQIITINGVEDLFKFD